jgi:hypothetical protein
MILTILRNVRISLLPANEDEHLTQTLEDIAMNQDLNLQRAMNKWRRC